jgi:hypothetical protein
VCPHFGQADRSTEMSKKAWFLVEEIFEWVKTVGGISKLRNRGLHLANSRKCGSHHS